jgi:hypothetical protein
VTARFQVEANFVRKFAVVLDNENETAVARHRRFLVEYARGKMTAHRSGTLSASPSLAICLVVNHDYAVFLIVVIMRHAVSLVRGRP